jgi:hypothetical protein
MNTESLQGVANTSLIGDNSTAWPAAGRHPYGEVPHSARLIAVTVGKADSMSDANPIRYYMKHLYGHSVMTISTTEWQTLVGGDGLPTLVDDIPKPLSGVHHDAEVVVVAASGITNATPGMDIVRRDIKDTPWIYNTDHYTVIEGLPAHPDYSRILKGAGVKDSQELQDALNSKVWIIGPERHPTHHWAKEIPEHIKKAQRKR